VTIIIVHDVLNVISEVLEGLSGSTKSVVCVERSVKNLGGLGSSWRIGWCFGSWRMRYGYLATYGETRKQRYAGL